MQQVPASQQVQQLERQLLEALVTKQDAEAQLKSAEAKIVAIRNVLAGLGIGQKLQQEIDAENAKVPAQP